MFSSNNPALHKGRMLALIVTAASAALNGVLWLWTALTHASDTSRTLTQILAAVTVLGGVVLGLLFALAYLLPDRAGSAEGA